MEFGVFTVADVTPDPTTGLQPTEGDRIAAMVAISEKCEEVGMDVFATGEHHNPPFVPSSPTTLLGFIAARTRSLRLSTSTTLITTNDPVKLAEDYATLQHLSGGPSTSSWVAATRRRSARVSVKRSPRAGA